MNEQVIQMIPHLKEGASYLFEHKRKGPFVAQFKGTIASDGDDPVDSLLIEVDIYTEDGSGQERLANPFVRDEHGNKVRPAISTKHIRPSLLETITTPSVEARRRLAGQVERAKEREKQFAGVTPWPEQPAMDRLGEPEEPKVEKKPFWKRVFGGGE